MVRVRTMGLLILAASLSIIIPFVSRGIVNLLDLNFLENVLIGEILRKILFYSIQTGLAVLFVRFVLHQSVSDMGFNFKNFKETIRVLKRFISIWFLLVITFYFISLKFVSGFNNYISGYYVKDAKMLTIDFIGGCLLAGVGEEPLFRGLIVILLFSVITKEIHIGKFKLPITAILSGILFMMAHIAYEVSPFRVVYVDYLQLFFTFVLGTVWATVLIRTKSLIGPIIAHSCANTIQIMTGYFVAYFILG